MSKPSDGIPRRAVVGALCTAAFSVSAPARALDPRVPIRLRSAARPLAYELPRRPRLAWRARVLEPLIGAPAADVNGRFVTAHTTGLVTELDERGRLRSSARVGAPLALGPVLLGDRRRLVVSEDGVAVILLPSSRIATRTKLGFREIDTGAVALATTDGGALVASGARFARLGPTGALSAEGSTREVIRGLLEWRGLELLVERAGRVLALGHAGDPFELADLERPLRSCARRGDRLLALVAERDLVELDLKTRLKRTLWSDAPLVPRKLFLLENGESRLVLAGGVVLGLDASHRETFRLPVAPGAGSDASVELVADARGYTLVASSSAELRLVAPNGDVSEIAGTACRDPLPPTPLANGHALATCRSGLLFGISDTER